MAKLFAEQLAEQQREKPGSLAWIVVLAYALIGFGVLLRLVGLFTRTVLWSDEAALALNIVDRELEQIARPFVFQQAAPYLFLIGEKLISLGLGVSESSLRLWPFLAGSLALPAVFWICVRLGDRRAGVFALLACCASSFLVYYSTELKPYSNDALVSALLLGLGIPLILEAPERALPYLPLAAAGALAPWISLPAVFVLAAVGSALAVSSHDQQRSARVLGLLVLIALAWMTSFSLHYFAFLDRNDPDAARVHEYWAALDGFPPFPPRKPSDLRWYIGKFAHTFGLLVAPVGYGMRYVASAFWLFGVWLLGVRARSLALLFALPFLFLWAAATAQVYVVTDRLILFMAPIALVPAALGLSAVIRVLGNTRAAHGVVWAIAASLAIAQALPTWHWLRRQEPATDIHSVVAQLRTRIEPGDRLFVAGNVAWIYQYYANRVGLTQPFVQTSALELDPRLADPLIASFERAPRVWAVVGALGPELSHNPGASASIAANEHYVVQQLAARGRELSMLDGTNVRAYLFDLSPR